MGCEGTSVHVAEGLVSQTPSQSEGKIPGCVEGMVVVKERGRWRCVRGPTRRSAAARAEPIGIGARAAWKIWAFAQTSNLCHVACVRRLAACARAAMRPLAYRHWDIRDNSKPVLRVRLLPFACV